METKKNYYGSLCTEMYEILHEKAPQDELDFYLSYAEKDKKILEPLCGSGRFLIPFMERGFDICGMDLSSEMLEKLKQKAPNAEVFQADILEFSSTVKYDYIFISSGSVSLFTDMNICNKILEKLKGMLAPAGKFVFAVDTVADKSVDTANDSDYRPSITVKMKEGYELMLKGKNYYDEHSQTQFSPSIYELYNGAELLQSEPMDFQLHLYKFGEMEQHLKKIGFKTVIVYSSFQKELATGNQNEMFLYECLL